MRSVTSKRRALPARQKLTSVRLATIAVAGIALSGCTQTAQLPPTTAPSADTKTTVPTKPTVEGVQTFTGLSHNHVQGTVHYQQVPPVGGDHSPIWLNCGIYSEPVPNENAVHDLEHGAVWVTYDAARITGDQRAALRASLPDSYIVLSPYQGLPSPIVVSAWGAQLQLDSVSDPRLADFLTLYWQSADSPEPGAPCTGGLEAPGRVL